MGVKSPTMSTITLDYSNVCQSTFDNFKSFKGYVVGYGGGWRGQLWYILYSGCRSELAPRSRQHLDNLCSWAQIQLLHNAFLFCLRFNTNKLSIETYPTFRPYFMLLLYQANTNRAMFCNEKLNISFSQFVLLASVVFISF